MAGTLGRNACVYVPVASQEGYSGTEQGVSLSLCACVHQNGRQQWRRVSVSKCIDMGTALERDVRMAGGQAGGHQQSKNVSMHGCGEQEEGAVPGEGFM